MTQLQLPAYLQNSSRSVAAATLAGLNQGQPAYISIKQNRFRLVDAGGIEKMVDTFHLDVVIADANPHISKIYYAEAFDPKAVEYKPPTCFSDNGVGPSEQALQPQCGTCAACPKNAWGSATSNVTGKQTKACNDVKKLACLVPGLAPGLSFQLRIPPASLKNLSAYVAGLNAQVTSGRRVDVTDVVTRLSFDPQTQGVLNFQAVNWIDEATYKTLEEKGDNPYPQLTGANDRPRTAALPAPATQEPVQQVAPQQQVVHTPQDIPQTLQGYAGQQGFMGAPAQAQTANGFVPPAEPQKRTRRTKAEMEAARAAEGLGKHPEPQQGFQPPPTQPAPQQQFGIVSNAPEPDAALSAAISNAFNLPM